MERRLKDSELTDKKIQEAMILLLNEKPYDKIKVVDITRMCGINRTTFYLFYESKEALLKEICNSFLDQYIDIFLNSLQYDKKGNVSALAGIFQNLTKYENMLKTVWEIRLLDFEPYIIMQNSVEKAVLRFLEQNHLQMKYDMTNELFSSLYSANVMVLVKWWIYNYKDYDSQRMMQVVGDSSTKGMFGLLENAR